MRCDDVNWIFEHFLCSAVFKALSIFCSISFFPLEFTLFSDRKKHPFLQTMKAHRHTHIHSCERTCIAQSSTLTFILIIWFVLCVCPICLCTHIYGCTSPPYTMYWFRNFRYYKWRKEKSHGINNRCSIRLNENRKVARWRITLCFVAVRTALTCKIFIKRNVHVNSLLHVVYTQRDMYICIYLFIEFGLLSVASVDVDAATIAVSSWDLENFMKNDDNFLDWEFCRSLSRPLFSSFILSPFSAWFC